MRPIHFAILGLLATALCFSQSLNGVEPQKATPVDVNQLQEQQQVLRDISNIRRKLGGSVLKGSVLDAGDLESDFQNEVGEMIGIPDAGKRLVATKKMAFPDVVKKLRTHSSELDRIANEIEPLREYNNADHLRNTANELRQIARQFDTQPAAKKSSAKPAQAP